MAESNPLKLKYDIFYKEGNKIGNDGCLSLSKANWSKLSFLQLRISWNIWENNAIKDDGFASLIGANWNLNLLDICKLLPTQLIMKLAIKVVKP